MNRRLIHTCFGFSCVIIASGLAFVIFNNTTQTYFLISQKPIMSIGFLLSFIGATAYTGTSMAIKK